MANRGKEKEKIEETGGELRTVPNEKWEKFFALFNEIETLEVAQWKTAHLLGYFVKKYRETYNIEYPWKFNNENPKKSFEVWQLNVMSSKLSANPQILKDYIDWGYANLVPKVKTKFRSISLFTKDENLIHYKMNVLLAGKKNLNVSRSTPLPNNYLTILKQHNYDSVATYGDLAFLFHMDPWSQNFHETIEDLQAVEFDLEVLRRIV